MANTTSLGAGARAGEGEPAAVLSIVRGEPTPEELAALVAVLASRAVGGGDPAPPPKVSGWTDRARYVRGRLPHSPGGWRAFALPR
jgi:hypothetical protein